MISQLKVEKEPTEMIPSSPRIREEIPTPRILDLKAAFFSISCSWREI
jgi:hypothetical protein